MLPRRRQAPTRYDEGGEGHVHDSLAVYFRQRYFEVLDILISEMTRRLEQPAFIYMQEMEAILCAQKPVEITTAFSEMYKLT